MDLTKKLRNLTSIGVLAAAVFLCADRARPEQPETSTPARDIDPSTLHKKVLCGYQGWFRCPGDSTGEGWRHWSRDAAKIAPDTVTFEMWPDVSEYTAEEKYAAAGFRDPDGTQAYLFSSAHPKTVERHFQWMQQYGIDGVFVQRFVVNLRNPSTDLVLRHVRDSAAATGRVYAICYDLTGAPQDQLHDLLTKDWRRLLDQQKLTADERYLHHNGRPVVFVWGFYTDRFGPEVAHRLNDFFQRDERYGATLVGGCQWNWREEKNTEWARVFRRFDVISPWNVGNVAMEGGVKHANTEYWKDDLTEARSAGVSYLPVIYPGFGWTNLKGTDAARANVPRLGGEFFWRQFTTAAELDIDMAYVAMFDEVDEATAIFKVSNSPPTQANFVTYEGLPADWYLRLTGEGSKLLRGERKPQSTLPINP